MSPADQQAAILRILRDAPDTDAAVARLREAGVDADPRMVAVARELVHRWAIVALPPSVG